MEKARRVWVAYDKKRIDGEWWWWNKEREVLVNARGRSMTERERKGEISGEGRRGA